MQSIGSIMQIAYVVDDIEAAINDWVTKMGAAPFFVVEHIGLINPRYRGQATDVDLTVAFTYSDSLCVELICQNNDVPSVYREHSNNAFHHWGIIADDFDEEVERYRKRGFEVAFDGEVEIVGRYAYIDTTDTMGAMVELLEGSEKAKGMFSSAEEAVRNWDGKNPVQYM